MMHRSMVNYWNAIVICPKAWVKIQGFSFALLYNIYTRYRFFDFALRNAASVLFGLCADISYRPDRLCSHRANLDGRSI